MWILSTGEKGGSGKTLMAMVALNHHIKHDAKPPVLIETDGNNPELLTAYAVDCNTVNTTHQGKNCEVYGYNIKSEGGRISTMKLLMNLKDSDRTVILNVGAGMAEFVAKFEQAFKHVPSVTLWTINRDKSCAVNLNNFLDIADNTKICVIKNGYHGEIEDFHFYDATNLSKRVPNIYIPNGPKLISEYCYSKGVAMHELEEKMDLVEWWETAGWIEKTGKVYEKILEIAAPPLPKVG